MFKMIYEYYTYIISRKHDNNTPRRQSHPITTARLIAANAHPPLDSPHPTPYFGTNKELIHDIKR